MEDVDTVKVGKILAAVRLLAVEYYQLTGKPLGVTGEIAEYVAAQLLGLTLAPARSTGYDALRGDERIQIKGRARGKDTRQQRISRIKLDAPCDTVLLVLLDISTLEPTEIWETSYVSVVESLSRPGSKSRDKGALAVSDFKRIANKVWPLLGGEQDESRRICPECGHQFKGNGFDGIDSHWRSKHEHIMPYRKAWPLIKSGTYQSRQEKDG